MKPIKDLRVLKPLAKKYGFEIDKEYKYVLKDPSLQNERKLRELGFRVLYVSGCFYPFVCHD